MSSGRTRFLHFSFPVSSTLRCQGRPFFLFCIAFLSHSLLSDLKRIQVRGRVCSFAFCFDETERNDANLMIHGVHVNKGIAIFAALLWHQLRLTLTLTYSYFLPVISPHHQYCVRLLRRGGSSHSHHSAPQQECSVGFTDNRRIVLWSCHRFWFTEAVTMHSNETRRWWLLFRLNTVETSKTFPSGTENDTSQAPETETCSKAIKEWLIGSELGLTWLCSLDLHAVY